MKMVYLVNPRFETVDTRPELCLNTLCLGTYLENKGVKVKVIDCQIERVEDYLEEIKDNALFVGLSVMTVQLRDAIRISKLIKNNSTVSVVWGGNHPTLFPKQCLSEDYVDYVIQEEGERALLCFARTGRIPEQNELIDVNELHPLKWELLNIPKYIRPHRLARRKSGNRHLRVHGGRGCTFDCNFCINQTLSRRCWRGVSAKNIFREIKYLNEKHGIDSVMIQDENFFCDKKRLKEFCELMIRNKMSKKVRWSANSRVTYLRRDFMSDELWKLVENSGCFHISFGIESGSQRVLDEVINKGITLEDSRNAVLRLKSTKIIPWLSFLIGMPNESEEEIKATMKFREELGRLNPNSYLNTPQIYRPYPGCKMYNEAVKLGFRPPKNNKEWLKFLYEGGLVSVDCLPWVKNKKLVVNLSEYGLITNICPGTKLEQAFGLVFRKLAGWRLRHNFFWLPIDKWLYFKLSKMYLRLVK